MGYTIPLKVYEKLEKARQEQKVAISEELQKELASKYDIEMIKKEIDVVRKEIELVRKACWSYRHKLI